jgi:predicted metal-dependent phosphotriesterase family hydrolase
MAHVQTVLGPIEPGSLGFTLPHEHTQIALWHIEGRWDYWQLTRGWSRFCPGFGPQASPTATSKP